MTDKTPERIWRWIAQVGGGWIEFSDTEISAEISTEYIRADIHEALSARVAELEGVMNMIETEISSAETWNPSIFNLVRQALTPPMEDKP